MLSAGGASLPTCQPQATAVAAEIGGEANFDVEALVLRV